MSTWAEAVHEGANPWTRLGDTQGTGMSLPGQGDLSSGDREQLRANLEKYKIQEGKNLSTQTNGRVTEMSDPMVSAARINQAYDSFVDGEEGKADYLKAAAKMPLGDLNDPGQRLKALSFITQNVAPDPNNPGMDNAGDQTCAGASIVGAAFLSEGPAGLKKVISAIENFDPNKLTSKKFASPEYNELKKKLEKDPTGKSLTVKDIQALQLTTTQVLNTNDPKGLTGLDSGVTNVTMDNFLENSPQLGKMFKDNGMQIQFTDNDGKAQNGGRAADHYVLHISGQDGGREMIYDPKARRGGQVIAFDDGVKQYNNANLDTIDDGSKPYANYAR